MFPIFIGIVIIGGVVGMFFLRQKRQPETRQLAASKIN
jgi:hypothetical protein